MVRDMENREAGFGGKIGVCRSGESYAKTADITSFSRGSEVKSGVNAI